MRRSARSALMLTPLLCALACGDKLDPGEPAETPAPAGTKPGATSPGTGTTTPGMTSPTTTTPGTTSPSTTTPGTSNPASPLCGTTATSIGYAAHAKTVIDSTCTSCHSANGQFPPLTTFATAKPGFADYGGLSQVDSGSMPRGQSLTDNQLCILDQWAAGGYLP